MGPANESKRSEKRCRVTEEARQVKERMRQNLNVHESIQLQTGRPQPGWLELNAGEARLTVNSIPSRDQVEVPIQEQLIVELYSK